MSEPASKPKEHDRPPGHPADKPWPPRLREYPPDHPARRDEESKVAFNEDWAREDFGDAFVDGLIERNSQGGKQIFAGDWWMLAMLIRCAELACVRDPAGESPVRFQLWNDLTYNMLLNDDIYVHLEWADMSGCQLEYSQYVFAHLEHAIFNHAHLTDAVFQDVDLHDAEFVLAKMTRIHLYTVRAKHSIFELADLSYAKIIRCTFERACLAKTSLAHADLSGTNLRHALLHDANLRHATLKHADLTNVILDRSSMKYASLDHAILRDARLNKCVMTGASVKEAILVMADVRGVIGLRFDANRARVLRIEGNAPDPWFTLRRKYTGPMFFVHFGLLLAFVLPYAGKVLALTAADHAGRMLGQATDHLSHSVPIVVEQVGAWRVLIGLDKGWLVPVLGAVLLVYNGLRALLTLRVGQLRDAEERSGITPTLVEYMGTQGLKDEGGGRIAIELFKGFIRWWLQGQSNRIGRGWSDFYAGLEALGLWRMHHLLRVLFVIAIASFLWHAKHWLSTTTVPMVRVVSQGDAPPPLVQPTD
ncbi:MAG: pentapeptide repeat-containing protein [Phycisphaerales bacterium]|nr:pentapeptide repeat-containing protein [Phycisphaerales bacterium]